MSKRNDLTQLFRQLQGLPAPLAVVLVIVVLLVLLVANRNQKGPTPEAPADGYLFCFWNVENLFDDIDDRRNQIDDRYDNEFANDANLRNLKLGNLSKVLLSMNGGRGPDILAVAEVESDRALELLQQRLNRDLGDRAAPYTGRLFKEQATGRHIAPGILTRLPVRGDRTQRLGQHYHRILEGHLEADGKQLVVIASHWTSRVPSPGAKDDKGDDANADSRAKYADVIYGRVHEMYRANPDIDVVVCGDFNDDPDDVSVTNHLRGTGKRDALVVAGEPRLLNLAAGKNHDKYGTLNHDNRWHLFDQVLASPGLLDGKGWTCTPETFATVRPPMENKRGRPWRFDEDFGGHRYYDKLFDGTRGYADHFPVTARLKVAGPAPE